MYTRRPTCQGLRTGDHTLILAGREADIIVCWLVQFYAMCLPTCLHCQEEEGLGSCCLVASYVYESLHFARTVPLIDTACILVQFLTFLGVDHTHLRQKHKTCTKTLNSYCCEKGLIDSGKNHTNIVIPDLVLNSCVRDLQNCRGCPDSPLCGGT